ncbi:hypothetical protein BDZ89DRAFT_1014969 [Hymenopellis radicata]|nr:hypothetical protein BDZ89DRAFT_1014969 [Hymenopellis radicata]
MPTAPMIDFSTTDLASSYSGFDAKIINNVLTEEECKALVDLAASTTGGWKPAALPAETADSVHSNFRHSERIVREDEEVASMLYQRLRPFVEEEIGVIQPKGRWCGITGKVGRKQGPTWTLSSVNPHLRFLRYGPGHFFKQHCDGLNEYDGMKSFVTLHLYLTDRDSLPLQGAGLAGGCTRFWTPDKRHFLDVEPKVGRVLVFQQRMLVHSGEEVMEGVKYTMRSDFMFQSSE